MRRGLVPTRFGYIHYRALGAGPAVTLFHINQQSSDLMVELMAALAPDFHPIAIDYPSHGHSDPVDAQPSLLDYAEAAIAVMDAVGVDKAAAMGEAVGADVSAALANAYPDRVARVVLINCPFSSDRGEIGRHIDALRAGPRPEDPSGFPLTRKLDFVRARDASQAPANPTQDWMDRANIAGIAVGRRCWQAVTALAGFDLEAGLRTLRQPALLLMGEHFHYTANLPEALSRLSDARHAILAGGRFCMSWERAAEIADHARACFDDDGTGWDGKGWRE